MKMYFHESDFANKKILLTENPTKIQVLVFDPNRTFFVKRIKLKTVKHLNIFDEIVSALKLLHFILS